MQPVETYSTENTDTLLITMGSYSETAMAAVDNLRNEGVEIGLVRIRLWRPFPFEEFKATLVKAKTVIVLIAHYLLVDPLARYAPR